MYVSEISCDKFSPFCQKNVLKREYSVKNSLFVGGKSLHICLHISTFIFLISAKYYYGWLPLEQHHKIGKKKRKKHWCIYFNPTDLLKVEGFCCNAFTLLDSLWYHQPHTSRSYKWDSVLWYGASELSTHPSPSKNKRLLLMDGGACDCFNRG
jgi:hypothetical protein